MREPIIFENDGSEDEGDGAFLRFRHVERLIGIIVRY